jgi:hypothetical protein
MVWLDAVKFLGELFQVAQSNTPEGVFQVFQRNAICVAALPAHCGRTWIL